jgi:putative endonuclease
VARNWRCRAGEIDLIARRGRQVVFCEVKARSSGAFGLPAEAVTPRKQAQVRRVARAWLGTGGGAGADLRFDVAAVLDGHLDLLEGAF